MLSGCGNKKANEYDTTNRISLKPRRRGFHLITEEVMSHLSALPATGLVNLL